MTYISQSSDCAYYFDTLSDGAGWGYSCPLGLAVVEMMLIPTVFSGSSVLSPDKNEIFRKREKIAVIILKFEQCGVTMD